MDTHCLNNEMSFETLDAIIKYIYVGTFDDVLLTEEGIKSILRAADYLGLDVVGTLRNPLKKVLTPSNVCSFYDFVLNTPLKGEINFFLLRNFSQIRLKESFLKVDVNIVDWVLKDGIAMLESEVKIFQTIELWINHDYVNRHKYFPRLVKNVRYVEVDEDEEGEGGSVSLNYNTRCIPIKYKVFLFPHYQITIDYAMTDILKWCICKESKNWFIHLLALMAGCKAQGPVRVAPRI